MKLYESIFKEAEETKDDSKESKVDVEGIITDVIESKWRGSNEESKKLKEMKIKPDLLKYISDEIKSVIKAHPMIISDYEHGNFPRSESVKDLQLRFCFDLYHIAKKRNKDFEEKMWYISKDLNLTDAQLYTALKKVGPKVTRKY
jgi:hypothetical protein